MIRAAPPFVAIALAAVATGCGEKRHITASRSSGSSSTVISETEFELTPASTSVAPGGTVTVTNDGGTSHALEIVLPRGEIRAKALPPGRSVTLRAPGQAGTYAMYCPIDHHEQKGMKGMLTVGGGGGSTTTSSGGGGGY